MNGGEVSAVTNCANCGAPLNGKYCAACGQRHEPHIHSLWEFTNEAAENITHADSRVWRTLWPLMFKPGFLTKEFLEGRRARYMPPFRLYLVLSVVFFLIATLGGTDIEFLSIGDGGVKRENLAELSERANAPAPASTAETAGAAKAPETTEQRATRLCEKGQWRMMPGLVELEPRMRAACHKVVLDNGHGLAEAFIHNIPRALIILLPLLAVVMRLLYLRRFYVEHLLFFIHTHAFTFVFLTLFSIGLRLIPYVWFKIAAITALVLLVPYYTYRAMVRVYAQGKWLTRLKFTALTLAYLTLGSLMAIVLSLYTMVTL